MELTKRIQQDIDAIEGRKTKTYRDIAKTYKKEMRELSMKEIYAICDELLQASTRANTIVAYQIVYDQKDKYDDETFFVFEEWLYKYIEDWWDCDDFMTHAFQYVLMKDPSRIQRIKEWINHERFAVRRSAAVILIVPAKKGLLEGDIIFEICDLLMDDPHYLVQKGYGWLLKEASKMYHDKVLIYLEKHVAKMTRTAFRYALEKLPKEEKARLMRL